MLKPNTYVSERATNKVLTTEALFFLVGFTLYGVGCVQGFLPTKFMGVMWMLMGIVPLMGESK
jgi:hypothetical protein